jgi:aryl-alcohol dehydrogenase-like predicted oxidoreductase
VLAPDLGPLGLGGMGLRDLATADAVLGAAGEHGVRLIDTADYYGGGANEELIGRALIGRRDQFVVSTKTGIVHRDGGPPSLAGDPDSIRAACDASLARLRTSWIDVYLLARIDPRVAVEESAGAMADLVAEGKVRAIGLSEAGAGTLRRAHAVHPLAVLQTEYALWERHAEAALLPACRELGIAFVACRPLGLGLLAGQRRPPGPLPGSDWRARDPRFAPGCLEANLGLAAPLGALAARVGCSPAALALAWLRGRGSIPLAGTTRPEHLAQNAGAAAARLDAGLAAEVSALFPDGARGDRYPPPLLALVDRA